MKRSWRELWHAFRAPRLEEERTAAERVWPTLPDAVRTDDQTVGRASAGCAATYGVMERCDFGCTACYLARGSNAAKPQPFETTKAQLDAIRAHLGPGGNVQITAGEVTLLPVEELRRIVAYAHSIGLSPMVMSHGQRFLREPDYLEDLVARGGLDRVGIHIDTTQRGRDGGDPQCEAELDPVRDAAAQLLRDTRERTGRRLFGAHLVTLNRDNQDDAEHIVRWAVENADAFRMVSFQPVAEVGRTRDRSPKNRRDAIWSSIEKGLGRKANDHPWLFGHPQCNQFAFFLVVRNGERRDLVEIVRRGSRFDAWFFRRILHGGFAGYTADAMPRSEANARFLGRFLRHPQYWATLPLFLLVRAATDWRVTLRSLGSLLRLRRPRIHSFSVVVHHFMDAAELETDEARERLEACVFRLPVDGEMVPMCSFNGTDQRAAHLKTLVPQPEPEPETCAPSSS
ncbi:MAG: radical SAM protein [Planctomycetota bacterium]